MEMRSQKERDGFLRSICTEPDDDTPRLIYADWLDEHGESERAEFIRVQCELARIPQVVLDTPMPAFQGAKDLAVSLHRRERELFCREWADFLPGDWFVDYRGPQLTGLPPRALFRRGFVAEINLFYAAFAGGPCGGCHGTGRAYNTADAVAPEKCTHCQGTGRIEGHAAALFRAAPVTRVVLSDREPADFEHGGRMVYQWDTWGDLGDYSHFLDGDLLGLLPGGVCLSSPGGRAYPTRQAALDALSAAALLLARRTAWPCPARCCTPHVWLGCPLCHGTGHTVRT